MKEVYISTARRNPFGAFGGALADTESVGKHQLTPQAKLVCTATHSIAPDLLIEDPVGAFRKCPEKAGTGLEQVGLFECV